MSLPGQPPVLLTEEENVDKSEDSESDYESDYDSDWDSDEEVDPIEKQIDHQNMLFDVNDDGVREWHPPTSSYTQKEIEGRSNFSSRNTYDSSSSAELRRFIKDRMLTDPYPQGRTLKYFYLRVLERDDRTKTFRFLDLIPELRNVVYKELLTFIFCQFCPTCHKPCFPSILRASKQIYGEAKAILYAENEVLCTFTAKGSTNGFSPALFFSSIHGRETSGDQRQGVDRLFYGMKHFPEYLHNIQRLHIDVVYRGGGMASARFSLQSCLINLASFLMDSHCLRKLRIHIYDTAENAEDDVAYTTELDGIVYPLRRLRGIQEVELTGVSDKSKTAIIADMKSTTSAFNTMKHMHHLKQETGMYLSMHEAFDPYNGGSWNGVGPPPRGYDLSDDIVNIDMELGDFSDMDEDYNAFLDAETELNTRRKMQDLKDCLARVDLDSFERRKKQYLAAKAKSAEYLLKSSWITPEGTCPVNNGVRRNWEPRLTEEDFW